MIPCQGKKTSARNIFDRLCSYSSIKHMEGNRLDTQAAQEFTGKQYEKLADWGERAALGGLGSLVVQQIILGVPLRSPSVIFGIIVSAFAYYKAYQWLKLSKSK